MPEERPELNISIFVRLNLKKNKKHKVVYLFERIDDFWNELSEEEKEL